MSHSAFELRFDEALNALTIRLHGMWDAAIMAQFQATMFDKIAELKARSRTWDVFVDARNFPVQSPVIASRVDVLFAQGRAVNTGYTAVVISSVLSKVQAQRVMGHERLRAFLDYDEATAWLKASRAALDGR